MILIYIAHIFINVAHILISRTVWILLWNQNCKSVNLTQYRSARAPHSIYKSVHRPRYYRNWSNQRDRFEVVRMSRTMHISISCDLLWLGEISTLPTYVRERLKKNVDKFSCLHVWWKVLFQIWETFLSPKIWTQQQNNPAVLRFHLCFTIHKL